MRISVSVIIIIGKLWCFQFGIVNSVVLAATSSVAVKQNFRELLDLLGHFNHSCMGLVLLGYICLSLLLVLSSLVFSMFLLQANPLHDHMSDSLPFHGKS